MRHSPCPFFLYSLWSNAAGLVGPGEVCAVCQPWPDIEGIALKLEHCLPGSWGRRLSPVSDRECAIVFVPPVCILQEAGGELGHRSVLEGFKQSGAYHFFQRKQLTALEDEYGECNWQKPCRMTVFLFCFSSLLRKTVSRGMLGFILIKRELKWRAWVSLNDFKNLEAKEVFPRESPSGITQPLGVDLRNRWRWEWCWKFGDLQMSFWFLKGERWLLPPPHYRMMSLTT